MRVQIRTDGPPSLPAEPGGSTNTRVLVPVNESESSVVRDFETLEMRVILYVVSRQQPRFPFSASGIPPLVQEPVLVSPTPQVVTRSPAGAFFEVRTDPRR
jgi:hypothetical protein